MNADLHKIRSARLFKSLPERVFTRIVSQIKVRAFLAAEPVLELSQNREFVSYIGYVVQGRILLLGDHEKPLGLVMKDEFFLGRPFSINDAVVNRLVSAGNDTMVVFIPKEMMNQLATASTHISELIEAIYDSIFERARAIASDSAAPKTIHEWIESHDASKSLSSWVAGIEKKRAQAILRRKIDARDQNIMGFAWGFAIVVLVIALVECFARRGDFDFSFSRIVDPAIVFEPFRAGSRFNIIIGIIGVSLIGLTNLHTFLVWGFKKFKWKVNYHLSSKFHMYFGIVGAAFVILHSAFNLVGVNVANFAVYAMAIGVASGVIGQFISNQIPKSIRGDKIKLEGLKEEQNRLQQKAELLIDNHGMFKTSVALISTGAPSSFWGHIFSAPLLWFRGMRVKSALRGLGLSGKSAGAAAQLLIKEYQLRQKIRLLEMSNVFFRKWMIIHRPLGYIVYILAAAHIILVTI